MTARRPLRAGSVPTRRASIQGRRGPNIRRASAGFGRSRALALLVLVVSCLAVYGATASSAFGYRRLDLTGARYSDAASVRTAIGLGDGANLFTVATDEIAARLRTLPAVTGVTIEAALPDTLRVRLTERQPVLVWQIGQQRFLAATDGVLFATDNGDLSATATGAADGSAALPVVDDRRSDAAGFAIGTAIDPIVFDAAARLASLRPSDIGSRTGRLHVSIDDARGFALDDGTGGWTAVFGFFTPTLRQTSIVPGQVRLLRSLLAGREDRVAAVILADEEHGTYTLKVAK